MRIARRIAEARESGTARIARITGEIEAAGQRILKLNVGEPDFNTPEFIAEAARRAIAAGKTRYTDVAGTRELREAVAQKFRSDNEIDCSAQDVIVGTGAKQLIFQRSAVHGRTGRRSDHSDTVLGELPRYHGHCRRPAGDAALPGGIRVQTDRGCRRRGDHFPHPLDHLEFAVQSHRRGLFS